MFNNSKMLIPVLLIFMAGAMFLAYQYQKDKPIRDAQAKYEYEHSTEYLKQQNKDATDRINKAIDSLNRANQPVIDSLKEAVELAKIKAGRY